MISTPQIKVGDTIKYLFPRQKWELGKVIDISSCKLATGATVFMFKIDNRDGIVFGCEVIGIIKHE